jgi:LPS-assembly protein
VLKLRRFCLTALPLLWLAPSGEVLARDLTTPPTPLPSSADVPQPANDQEVAFSANTLDYDNDADIVTAGGDVRMLRDGNRLRADKVIWNRKTGEVTATGNVAVVNANGDTAYGDNVQLKDTLKDGVAENLLLILKDGGRLAADKGVRVNGITTLRNAAYTPCSVVDSDGCPKAPIWKITAVKVIHNPDKHRIYYKDARLSLFSIPILWLPGLSHPDGADGNRSGLLVPLIRYNSVNGVEVATPYYLNLAPNRDLLITPHFFTQVAPALQTQFRALTSHGAYQIDGMVTEGTRSDNASGLNSQRRLRGYVDANGKFQLDPYWSITGSMRLTTDRTFLQRYDVSWEDRLRTTLNVERIDSNSYLSIAGWAVQTLRIGENQRQQPIALPAIDYRRRLIDPLFGGVIQIQGNSLAILRTGGQDTQRAFIGLRWDLRRITALGQEVTFTLYGRGDLYHTAQTDLDPTPSYRGLEGWHHRGIAAAAVDMRWPFTGDLWGGAQQLSPRVQIVASPRTSNLSIPNEDARSVDLDDSNLFALNRFPGYDRWEDGPRITYGADWLYQRPRLVIQSVVGQSFRLNNRATILPVGTGLSDRLSDIVGRTTVRYDDFISLTHRYRLDKDNFALRRNEIDLTLGSRKTYATVGYLRLDRNITTVEDLQNHEEIRLGARLAFARYWSIFGSAVIDLTGKNEDPTNPLADGFSPVRNRLGIAYDDECVTISVTWRRQYFQIGDARATSSFLLRLALKNLGR